jgi:phosphoglycerate dehydrogenase-like enzyme
VAVVELAVPAAEHVTPRAYGLVIGDIGDRSWSVLAASAPEITFVDSRDAGPQLRATAEVLFVWDFRSHEIEELWDELTALRWVHTASAGVDHILFPRLRSSDVVVTNSAGIYSQSIAEYVMAILLFDLKGLSVTLEAQRAHQWSYRETELLRGKSMCVIGMGDVGRAIAQAGQSLGLRVSGIRRSASSIAVGGLPIHSPSRIKEAVAEADYVVVAAPLTQETTGLVNARVISAMKPSAYLVNVGRGPIIDERALVSALRSGRLRGAALDTFGQEPVPHDSELWSVPGLLVSPHMAGDAAGWQARVLDLFGTNVERYLRGKPLLNLIDKGRGY